MLKPSRGDREVKEESYWISGTKEEKGLHGIRGNLISVCVCVCESVCGVQTGIMTAFEWVHHHHEWLTLMRM